MRARIALALALPALADAYTVWSSTPDATNIVKLPTIPVDVAIHDAGTTSPNATTAVFEILAAFGQWESVPGTAMQFNEGPWSGPHFAYGSDSGINGNRVGFVLSGWPASASSALAVTAVQGGGALGNRFIDEADIYINEHLYDWSDGPLGEPGLFDVRSVVTHEVGHFIGLDHSPIVVATMYYAFGPGDTGPGTLHADDAEGARFLYPNPPPHTCATDGQCPTVQRAFDSGNEVFGNMVCADVDMDLVFECCLGGVCGTGTAGNVGDPCQRDPDCGPGLHCPFNGDTCQACGSQGAPFPDCGEPQNCLGDECWFLESDDTCGNCLPPCTIQFECFADVAHCLVLDPGPPEDKRCVPDEATGYYRCKIYEPSQCPTGHGCLRTTIGEICFPRGTGGFGDPCSSDTECYSLLCDGSMGDTCAQACGTGWPECPAGYACEIVGTLQLCHPFGPEPVPEPTPEPVPEPAPDAGPDAPAAPEPLMDVMDEGCACAVGAPRARATHALALLALVAALAPRRRRV